MADATAESALAPGEASTAVAELPAPKVPTGPATILGYLGAVGAVLAALEGNDVATAVGGIALIVSQLGRYAQAVMIARTVARAAKPWVDAVADLSDEPR